MKRLRLNQTITTASLLVLGAALAFGQTTGTPPTPATLATMHVNQLAARLNLTDAQKTSAMQTNKNLLLSKEALVHTKPQLEIFANDVKCKHGATIGQLDADVLFYLRSRGIGLVDARRLLIHAFVSEIIDTVKVDAVRSQIGGCMALFAGGA